jgi:tetratricopeptide (TPR) repeat protein
MRSKAGESLHDRKSTTMKFGTLLLASCIAALIASGGFAYHWYTRPQPPRLALDGVAPHQAEAIEAARQEVRRAPRSAATWGQLAMVLSAAGYSEPANISFGYAARFDPEDARWPYLHAIELAKMGSVPDSVLFLQKARTVARTQEERTTILFRLGRLLIEEGYLDSAAETVQELAGLEPEGARVLYLRGVLANVRGDSSTAMASLGRLTNHPSARKMANQLLANLTKNDMNRARAFADQASTLPSDEPWSDPFLEDFERHTGDPTSKVDQYRALMAQGRSAEALELLRRAVKQSPDFETAYALGVALLQAKELEEAVETLRTALRLDARQAKTHLLLAGALVDLGEDEVRRSGGSDRTAKLFQQAVSAAEDALALQSNWADAQLVCGRALLDLGQTDAGVRAFRDAVLSQPQSAEAHLEWGWR